jgi:type I restriction enzyme R subunit
MRLKNILESFADFDDAAKPLSDQTLADFTSKYLDIHDKVKKHSSKEKVSILEDVDFEVSLIHRDEINVGYILRLLAGIQAMPPKSSRSRRKRSWILSTATSRCAVNVSLSITLLKKPAACRA